ncbi:MAG: hypothetical protein QF441_06865 [Bacteriovoracaceae bacterium]|jgi:hypothetical protein|nr:hypothetical protein [Halobacteriovoraceae bacterium]MDP7320313.1 hypothetical protein [Bacteriovoracaceae bacterium]
MNKLLCTIFLAMVSSTSSMAFEINQGFYTTSYCSGSNCNVATTVESQITLDAQMILENGPQAEVSQDFLISFAGAKVMNPDLTLEEFAAEVLN